MNQTEYLAFKLLKEKKGYKEKEIIFRPNKSPDFICLDGKRYEVKFLRGNQLIFYSKQIRDLNPEDNILVFDRKEFITEFMWGDRDKTAFDIKTIGMDNLTTIQINEKTLQKLKKVRLTNRESYNDVINRLIDPSDNLAIYEFFSWCKNSGLKASHVLSDLVLKKNKENISKEDKNGKKRKQL